MEGSDKIEALSQAGGGDESQAPPLPVVGIGGSAGSIEALEDFFRSAAPDSGIAYVVILHLLADHESSLAEILQRWTEMPVSQVNGSLRLETDHVYVIPPFRYLVSVEESLELREMDPVHGRRTTVDLFFRTLADTHGSRAIAIVLSGLDGDGALGVKRIRERGGLTMVQDPEEALETGMPEAAIATGTVDWVLHADEMPARLIK